MIESLRKALKSWLATALILLLIASFAVWGIGDTFSTSGGSTISEIGETELDAETYYRAVQRYYFQVQQQAGRMSVNEFRERGFDTDVLRELIRTKALDEEARRLGLDVPDARVVEQIQAIVAAETGAFSVANYREMVRRRGFEEAEYEAFARSAIVGQVLTGPVVSAVAPVPGVAEIIARRMGERRAVRLIRLDAGDVAAPEAPAEDVLAAWFAENTAAFRFPELRTGAAVIVDIAPLVAANMPDDAEVERFYQQNAERFSTPPVRDIDQVVFETEAAAADAVARLASGAASFEEIAREAGLSPDQAAFGEVTPETGLPGPVAEAVFGTDTPGIVGPVATGAGFAVIRINAVSGGEEMAYEEASARIALAIATEAARTAARDIAVEVEDLRAAGQTFAEIAETLAASGVGRIGFEGIAANGATPAGLVPDGLPPRGCVPARSVRRR